MIHGVIVRVTHVAADGEVGVHVRGAGIHVDGFVEAQRPLIRPIHPSPPPLEVPVKEAVVPLHVAKVGQGEGVLRVHAVADDMQDFLEESAPCRRARLSYLLGVGMVTAGEVEALPAYGHFLVFRATKARQVGRGGSNGEDVAVVLVAQSLQSSRQRACDLFLPPPHILFPDNLNKEGCEGGTP